MKTKYVNRWGYTISERPTLPGVWRRKEGGFLVRGRATDPRTKKQHEIMRALDGDDPAAAHRQLQELLATIRNPVVQPTTSKVLFADYAVSLLARKVQRGDIKSAKARRLWGDVLEQHLITPRAMRRTFQDLDRAAEVRDLVTRSISGHATEEMQRHYSTVGETEQRDGLARVVSLAGFREALRAEAQSSGPGDQVVGKSP